MSYPDKPFRDLPSDILYKESETITVGLDYYRRCPYCKWFNPYDFDENSPGECTRFPHTEIIIEPNHHSCGEFEICDHTYHCLLKEVEEK